MDEPATNIATCVSKQNVLAKHIVHNKNSLTRNENLDTKFLRSMIDFVADILL